MTRRGFLALIGSAAAALVVANTRVLGVVAAAERRDWIPSVWKACRWHVKAFDHGNACGVALELHHPITGILTRQAARFAVPSSETGVFAKYVGLHGTTDEWQPMGMRSLTPAKNLKPGSGSQVLENCRIILTEWAHEEAYRQGLVSPPAWWRATEAATVPGIVDERILEGHEFVHPDRPEALRRFRECIKRRRAA